MHSHRSPEKMMPSPSSAAVVGDDDQNIELQIHRHMGCMAGFLHLFDRPHILAGKRRLPTFPDASPPSPSERSESSLSSSHPPPSPEASPESCAAPTRPSVSDGVRSSWKLREAPRFSLDSRAVVDVKGKLRPRSDVEGDQRRSPSVVARLMGLDALPDHNAGDAAVLRRSASESRVPRDRTLFRVVESSPFQSPPAPEPKTVAPLVRAPAAASPLQRKSFEFFPEPKGSGLLYGEIERRLRARGIDEPVNTDLEALKQILEALQLKGLLHSKFQHRQSTSAAMKSPRRLSPPLSTKPATLTRQRVAPERQETIRSLRGQIPISPDRAVASKTPNKPARRRPSSASTPPSPPVRRGTAVHSPRTSPKRIGPDSPAVRSPRNWKAMPVEDDASTIVSDSSISYSTQYELERSPMEYRSGRSILQRCDKLLNSIAAITSSPANHTVALSEQQQPSPVSVLDASSFLGGDELSSPSPAPKLSLDFKDSPNPLGLPEELDHWIQSPETPSDLAYISEILRLSERLRDPSEVYTLLEKRRQWAVNGQLEALRVHRRLVFDAVAEILDRKRSLPPWDVGTFATSGGNAAILREMWEEMRRLRVPPVAGDLNEITRGAIRKDMRAAGDRAWCGACCLEVSDAVLYVERQIFKDIVGETICELTGVETRSSLPRRRLVFRDPSGH